MGPQRIRGLSHNTGVTQASPDMTHPSTIPTTLPLLTLTSLLQTGQETTQYDFGCTCLLEFTQRHVTITPSVEKNPGSVTHCYTHGKKNYQFQNFTRINQTFARRGRSLRQSIHGLL